MKSGSTPKPTSQTLLAPRLDAPTTLIESLRIERGIAMARIFLTILATIQITVDPIEPISYAPIAYLFLIFFAAHSLSALFVLRTRQETTRAFLILTTTIDLVGAAMTLPMASTNNPFFAFFLFVLAQAAFRWGFRETMAVSIAGIALVILRAYLSVRMPPPYATLLGDYEFDRAAARVAYLVMMGVLLGYLAEESRLLRAEAAAAARLVARVRGEGGLTHAVAAVVKDLLDQFKAARLLLVAESRESKRLFRWDTTGGWGVAPTTLPSEVQTSERDVYLFCPHELSMAIRKRWWLPRRARYQTTALDSVGRVVDGIHIRVPDRFAASQPFRRMISVPLTFDEEWSGRLYLADPRVNVRPIAITQFLQTIIRQVSPALYGVYLSGQLQARAGALERARVARELHDGVIQSLIGVEMQLEVLRNQAPVKGTTSGEELGRLQYLVHSEVLNLRELMQQMRPPEFDPDELLVYLADMVQRFGRDTGIAAQFLTELTDVRVPWRICLELVRIVQEGLVNVRKHSAATNVTVRFAAQDNQWKVEITDNGRGFPFEGQLRTAELEKGHRGPTIIKERVKAIGGQLAIHSTPGRGTRLEILVPQEAHG